jgi:hypothetical protein
LLRPKKFWIDPEIIQSLAGELIRLVFYNKLFSTTEDKTAIIKGVWGLHQPNVPTWQVGLVHISGKSRFA